MLRKEKDGYDADFDLTEKDLPEGGVYNPISEIEGGAGDRASLVLFFGFFIALGWFGHAWLTPAVIKTIEKPHDYSSFPVLCQTINVPAGEYEVCIDPQNPKTKMLTR